MPLSSVQTQSIDATHLGFHDQNRKPPKKIKKIKSASGFVARLCPSPFQKMISIDAEMDL